MKEIVEEWRESRKIVFQYMPKKKPIEPTWTHPGGKLLEKGAESLSDAELLSILIGTGIKGKSAEQIGEEIIRTFDSFRGMSDQPLEKFLKIKGLGDVKIIRIAAAFEIARRIVEEVIKDYEPDKK